jgi:rubrerythrin
MSILTAGEVVQFAVRIEENGYNFYKNFAATFKNEQERTLFSFLAEEEMKHLAVFKKMLGDVGASKPRLNYPDEYSAYLQAYADNLIFTESSLKKEIDKIKDVLTALDFGVRRELDSILYYQEIKAFVPKNDADLIDGVIREERAHFLKLSGMKKDLK